MADSKVLVHRSRLVLPVVLLAAGLSLSLCPRPARAGLAVGVCGDTIVDPEEDCDDGNTLDGDCCSSTCRDEESVGGNENTTLCDGGGRCSDGIDNDGDGLVDSEDPECSTLSEMQRHVLIGSDAAARVAVQVGSRVFVHHTERDGSFPVAEDFWMKATCDTEAGSCRCPDTQTGVDPTDPNGPQLPRPACQTQGQACTVDKDCEPGPYPAEASWAAICGASVYLKAESMLEGDIATTGSMRYGRGYLGGDKGRTLIDQGSDFYCDGCIERLDRKTPRPNVRFESEAPWVGPGLCLPSGLKSCFRDEDCCLLPELTTCFAPAVPGDMCNGRRLFDFLDPNDAAHNLHTVLTGGTLDPNDPISVANGYDDCVGALAALARLSDPNDPTNLGATNLPGTAGAAIDIKPKSSRTLTFAGGGTHVVNVPLVKMGPKAELNLSAPADAVLVFRVHGKFRLGAENVVNLLDGVEPHNVLWLLEGDRPAVVLTRNAEFPGTVLAPSRRMIRMGAETHLSGGAMGPRVVVKQASVLKHRPFIALLPTNLEVTKSGTPAPQNPDAPAGAVVAGETVQYTIDVTNHGPSYAPGVVVTDVLPAKLVFVSIDSLSQGSCTTPASETNGTVKCHLGTMAQGDTEQIKFTARVKPDTAAAPVNNTATVAGNVEESVPSNNSATESTPVVRLVDMVVSNGAGSPSPEPVVRGSSVTYTWDVTNNGPSNANAVHVTATTPAGLTVTSAPGCTIGATNVVCALGTIASGDSTSLTIQATVDCAQVAALAHTMAVTAVTEAERASTAGNESATQTTTTTDDVAFTITKTDGTDPVEENVDDPVYEIKVTNTATYSCALNVEVLDTPPLQAGFSGIADLGGSCAGSPQLRCDLAQLSAGATWTITINGTVANGTAQPNTLDEVDNTATVASDEVAGAVSSNTEPTDVLANQGDACGVAGDCATGFCRDGVCCDTACTGTCLACDLAGSVGTCSAVANADDADTCDGDSLACGGLDDCTCDVGGQCKGDLGAQTCSAAGECGSGFCADGTCCSSACGGTCEACDAGGSEGTCTGFAAQTDPDAECAPACSVCDGNGGNGAGACVDATDGTNPENECGGSNPACCSTGCADLDSDHDNCGVCGNACTLTQTCNAGICEEV